ncbi:MAG: hypothetical protein LBN95_01970 [Prevotellaceae bacterium]|jgi:hypothetical protein|nr:hypothetical protein [Prevotellaceae bacterium]
MKTSKKTELKSAAIVLSSFTLTGLIGFGFCWLLSKWLIPTMLILAVLLFIIMFCSDNVKKWREEEKMINESIRNNHYEKNTPSSR